MELEERVDKLRSILAQLEFSHVVCDYDRRGVPFQTHLHVPEVHPVTGHHWYEREDPAHVLKVSSYIILNYVMILICLYRELQNVHEKEALMVSS